MTTPSPQENSNSLHLQTLFAQTNQKSLPSLPEHVMELIFQLGEPRVSVQELTNTILKDYALTARILQVVNSAYYSGGNPISTVSRAVNVVGLEAMRQLATAMALLDEFLKNSMDQGEITKYFTISLVSATQSRLYCQYRPNALTQEEAYLCSLLHKLGSIILLVYLPDHYRRITQLLQQGYSEEYASGQVLDGLTCSQIGREIATFWNFPKRTIGCMEPHPASPDKSGDTFLLLHNLVVFNNTLTTTFFTGTELDLTDLICRFGAVLNLDRTEAMELLDRAIGICENLTPGMNNALMRLQKQRDRRPAS